MGADRELIQIVDAALAEAERRAGPWLACRPGCTPCCMGPFPITAADAMRLQNGLAALDRNRAAQVRQRAEASVARIERDYPGDTLARILQDEEAAAGEPCPALDPETGLCELYEARPITCRTFGPPVHFKGDALAVCELCFQGAGDEEIAACAVEIDTPIPDYPDTETDTGTIVAYALLGGAGF